MIQRHIQDLHIKKKQLSITFLHFLTIKQRVIIKGPISKIENKLYSIIFSATMQIIIINKHQNPQPSKYTKHNTLLPLHSLFSSLHLHPFSFNHKEHNNLTTTTTTITVTKHNEHKDWKLTVTSIKYCHLFESN